MARGAGAARGRQRSLCFSVAVCTRNRAVLLERALCSLARQSLDAAAFEVLIVDNGSTDTTAQVSAAYTGRWAHMRRVEEPRAGLSHARNCAMREAKGAYVAFLDDDAIAPPTWLALAEATVRERAPKVFGGPFRAYLDAPAPRWFRPSYASYEPRSEAGPLAVEEYIPGANFFMERALLLRLGGFDPAYGKAGEEARYGEETELLLRAREVVAPADIWFAPELFVYHRVDPRSFQLAHWFGQTYLRGVSFGEQRGARLPRLSPLEAQLRRGVNLARVSLGATWGALARDRTRFPCAQNFLVERLGPRVFTLGTIDGRLRARAHAAGGNEETS